MRGVYERWDPSAQSDSNKSEQVKQCMDLKHCLHWLHAVAPTHLVQLMRSRPSHHVHFLCHPVHLSPEPRLFVDEQTGEIVCLVDLKDGSTVQNEYGRSMSTVQYEYSAV